MSTEDPFKQIAKILEERQAARKLLSTYDEHCKSFKNFEDIKRSKKCGCYNCKKIFQATEIDEWVIEKDDGQKTALCPYCGIDSVIQDSNVEITPELLEKMNTEWF